MKKFISLLVLFLAISWVGAQQQYLSISGIVRDLHDNSPLADASVSTESQSVQTDANGHYRLIKIPAGNHHLTVSHPDCSSKSYSINLQQDQILNIYLEHHTNAIETVVVHAQDRNTTNQPTERLSEEQLKHNANENIGNLLSNLSGVSGLKTGNNIVKPVIRGMSGSRIAIVQNGVRLAEQEWGVEHAPNIEPSMFQNISVVKGAGVLKYTGEAVGGTIVLDQRNFPAKDTLMGNVQLSGYSNGRGGKISTNIAKTWENRWYVSAGGAYSKSGDLYIPHHTLQNTGSEENSFHLEAGRRQIASGFQLSYKIIGQDFGIFTGSHLGSPLQYFQVIRAGGAKEYYDDFHYRINNPKQEVLHQTAQAEGFYRFGNFGMLKATYSLQINHRKEFDIRRGALSDLPGLDLTLTTHSANLDHTLERGKWKLETGISGRLQDNYTNPATLARRLIPDYQRYDAGAYSVFTYRWTPQWQADVSARYDFSRYDAYKYYDQTEWYSRFAKTFSQFFVRNSGARVLTHPVLDFSNASFSGGINWKPADDFSVKMNISRASRTPNAAELFADGLHHSAAIVERGELSIKSEQITQINLDLEGKLPLLSGLSFEISPYYYFSKNFINQIPSGVQSSNRGVFPIWDYQQISAQVYGLDADVTLNFSPRLIYTGQFSYIHGQDTTSDHPLILMPPARLRNRLELRLLKENRLKLSAEHQYTAHQARYPIFNVPLTYIDEGLLQTVTVDLSTPPPAYHLFNVGIDYSLSRKVSMTFKVDNLFNTEYRDYLNRLRFFSPELGRNFILNLNYKF